MNVHLEKQPSRIRHNLVDSHIYDRFPGLYLLDQIHTPFYLSPSKIKFSINVIQI